MRLTSLGFQTDVALRVAEGAEVTDRGDCLVIRSPENPGFWWGNFLLLRVWPKDGDGWLDRFAAEFPQAGHVAIGVDVTEPGGPLSAEFATLEPETSTVLTSTVLTNGMRTAAELPPAPPGPAAEIRTLVSNQDWHQSVELNLRCYGEQTPADFQPRRTAARRRMTEAGRAAWFGAFHGDRLVAQLGVCDAGGGLARYQDVETDPAARRQGLAGSLVAEAARFARAELGAATLVIVADPAGEAIRVYRRRGFADAQTQVSLARPAA